MSGDVVPSDTMALQRIEKAVREFCAAMRASEGTSLTMLDIVPTVITVFREEGVAFDASTMQGLGGMLG